MVVKKLVSVDFNKIFGNVSPECSKKSFKEFEFKDFGDYILFGVKEKKDVKK